MRTTVCPKCRAMGLTTDCADQLKHGRNRMIGDEQEDYELEVTLTFTVPVVSSQPVDPHEMATHMRESWMNDDKEFTNILGVAVEGEYELSVAPFFVGG